MYLPIALSNNFPGRGPCVCLLSGTVDLLRGKLRAVASRVFGWVGRQPRLCITGAQLGPSSSSRWRGQPSGVKRNLRQHNLRGQCSPQHGPNSDPPTSETQSHNSHTHPRTQIRQPCAVDLTCKAKSLSEHIAWQGTIPAAQQGRPSFQLRAACGGADRYPTWVLYPPSTPTRPAREARSTQPSACRRRAIARAASAAVSRASSEPHNTEASSRRLQPWRPGTPTSSQTQPPASQTSSAPSSPPRPTATPRTTHTSAVSYGSTTLRTAARCPTGFRPTQRPRHQHPSFSRTLDRRRPGMVHRSKGPRAG